MSSQNALKLAGAIAGAIAVGSRTDSALLALGGLVVGSAIGSEVGKSIDNGSLRREVERLQLLEEKQRIEARMLAIEHNQT